MFGFSGVFPQQSAGNLCYSGRMRRVALLAALVAGCAPTVGQVSPSGGIIKNYGWTPNQSLELAQKHCAQYGKDAIVTHQNDLQDNMTFQCVARGGYGRSCAI